MNNGGISESNEYDHLVREAELRELEGNFNTQLSDVKGEVNTQFSDVKGEVRTQFSDIKGDIRVSLERSLTAIQKAAKEQERASKQQLIYIITIIISVVSLAVIIIIWWIPTAPTVPVRVELVPPSIQVPAPPQEFGPTSRPSSK